MSQVLENLPPSERLRVLRLAHNGEVPFEPTDDTEQAILISWLENRVTSKAISNLLKPVKANTKAKDNSSIAFAVLLVVLLILAFNFAFVLLLNYICLWLFGWAVTLKHMFIIWIVGFIWNSIFQKDKKKDSISDAFFNK